MHLASSRHEHELRWARPVLMLLQQSLQVLHHPESKAELPYGCPDGVKAQGPAQGSIYISSILQHTGYASAISCSSPVASATSLTMTLSRGGWLRFM